MEEKNPLVKFHIRFTSCTISEENRWPVESSTECFTDNVASNNKLVMSFASEATTAK